MANERVSMSSVDDTNGRGPAGDRGVGSGPTTGFYALSASSVTRPESVSARQLRYLLVAELIGTGRAMTIPDLIASLTEHGFVIGPSANKVISDTLRWQVTNGRVRKVRRGVYVAGTMPRSTKAWIKGTARCHRALVRQQIDGDHVVGHGNCDPNSLRV
jgi:hypothetical protein